MSSINQIAKTELMDLSIIIVNYNSTQLILNCLGSVYNQPSNISFEIIIVDNASVDDPNLIITAYPQIKWIQMNYNSGFARANNEGIRNSKANVILLLNADTIIENNAIGRCYRKFVESKYIACGVQLLNIDRSPQISGNYVIKGGLNYLLPLPYLGSILRFLSLALHVKKPHVPNAKNIVEVDWINGAYLMVKRSAIKEAGLLDEDFFIYAEEAEWCSRLRKIGSLCIYGDINLVHLQGEIANVTYNSKEKGYKNLFDKKGLQLMLSNLVRIRKQFGVFWFLFILSIFLIEMPIFFFGYIISKLFFNNNNRYSFESVVKYASNVFYVLKLTPKIVYNKPYFYKT